MFVKTSIFHTGDIYTLKNQKGILCHNCIDSKGIKESDKKKIVLNPEVDIFIKYHRALSGEYDENNIWRWNILEPVADENGNLIIKYQKSTYTHQEFLDIIAEYESDGGIITNPIGLLNQIFDELIYPK